MKGDFTRFTHDAKKHYTRVLKQQGRAELDADFNEYVELTAGLARRRTRDVIGKAGVPKGDAFKIGVTADGKDLTIGPGRMYVEGILCELPGEQPVSYRRQPDYVSLPELAPVVNRKDLVYLDVWERHITALEDPELLEAALGGADTSTRVRTICQVKIQEGVAAATCQDAIAGWPPSPLGGGLLTTRTVAGGATDSLCVLPPTGGYRGLENRLYRVEIHEGGSLAQAKFKWSRDNGAVVFAIAQFQPGEPTKVQLKSLGRDQVLALRPGDWVEVLGDQTELKGLAGTLAKIDKIEAGRVLVLDRAVNSHSGESHPKVRRWDQGSEALGMNNGQPIDLEDGIQVSFSGADFRVGEYWVFTARTGSAGLEILTNAPPRGIHHHYARLALITWKQVAGQWKPDIADCRDQFPPLTGITAEDVAFDNSLCQLQDAETVQDALEVLCQRERCTLIARPGPGWEKVFDKVPAQGAHICFLPGEYKTDRPVEVKDKGPMVLHGAGEATRLVAEQCESALIFTNCGRLTMRDLLVRATTTGSGGAGEHLNGALAFRNCSSLILEGLSVACADGSHRAAACISVHGSPGRLSQVTIEKCRLRVGVQQVGLLVVDGDFVQVRNNLVGGTVDTSTPTFVKMLQDPVFRAGVRRRLISNLHVDVAPPAGVVTNVQVNTAGHTVRFLTRSALDNAWRALIAQNPPPQGASAEKVAQHLKRLADRILLDNPFPAFQAWRKQTVEAGVVSSQGITLGGRAADNVRILDNTIVGVMQGIHVGVSHQGPRTEANTDRAGRVVVNGNWVRIHTALGATRDRHGVFVGNCDSLLVRNNYLAVQRHVGTEEMSVEGVRVFGYFGRMIMIRENHIVGFNTGVTVEPRGTLPPTPMWWVVENLTAGAAQSVKANPPVVKASNIS